MDLLQQVFKKSKMIKTKSPNINDDDFDLDALAEALEQAASLASNSKKPNKFNCTNTPIKRPVLKEKTLRACEHEYGVYRLMF